MSFWRYVRSICDSSTLLTIYAVHSRRKTAVYGLPDGFLASCVTGVRYTRSLPRRGTPPCMSQCGICSQRGVWSFSCRLHVFRLPLRCADSMARFAVRCIENLPLTEDFIGSFIPANTLPFILNYSERISTFAPEITLDFILQWSIGFLKSTTQEKLICLEYVSPWIRNLGIFLEPSSGHFDESRVRECIRLFIDMTIHESEVIEFQTVLETALTIFVGLCCASASCMDRDREIINSNPQYCHRRIDPRRNLQRLGLIEMWSIREYINSTFHNSHSS